MTDVSLVLACCPPGPPLRVTRQVSAAPIEAQATGGHALVHDGIMPDGADRPAPR